MINSLASARILAVSSVAHPRGLPAAALVSRRAVLLRRLRPGWQLAAAARGPCRPRLRLCRWAGGIAWRAIALGRIRAGQDHGRTGQHEAAKLRHELTDFRQEPSGRAVGPSEGKGQPGPQPPSARRARMHAHGLALGCREGREGQLASGWAAFPGGWTFGNDSDLRSLLADNYNQAATGQPQKARRHKGRTKTSLAILAGTPAAAPKPWMQLSRTPAPGKRLPLHMSSFLTNILKHALRLSL
jgi:hypothetical protein